MFKSGDTVRRIGPTTHSCKPPLYQEQIVEVETCSLADLTIAGYSDIADSAPFAFLPELFELVHRASAAPTPVKDSNPKEAAGADRMQLHLVPDGPLAHVATAFFEGATKYGAYNWRVAGVRASTYISALRRHVGKWWNGERTDPKTGVHHLANATACLLILIDAEIQDKLTDDRPPKQDLQGVYDALVQVQEGLKKAHAHLNPKQYTELNK